MSSLTLVTRLNLNRIYKIWQVLGCAVLNSLYYYGIFNYEYELCDQILKDRILMNLDSGKQF
jgi:hypothetical protein